MSQMQKEVDEWKLLGQYGTGVYQVSYQRVPSQTGATPLSLHFPVHFTYMPEDIMCKHITLPCVHVSAMLNDKHTCVMYTHSALCGGIFVVDGAPWVTLKLEIEPRHSH